MHRALFAVKSNDFFVDRLSYDERETLATIVYYPKQKIKL